MKKKVLIVATVLKIHIMVFHLPTIKLLHDMGYEVHVCARNDYENKEKPKIPYCDKYFDLPFERFPLKICNLYVLKRLSKIIDDNKYDIIHCHTPSGALIARLASLIAIHRSKLIYTAHGFHFYKGAPLQNWLLYYPVEWLLSYYTDVLITINTEDYELAKHHMHAKRVEYLPGVGIDVEKFADTEIDKKAKRRELGIPEGCKLLLSVGELNKNKNHQVIIKAISELNDPSIHYAICGKGELYNYLIKLAKSLNIENQIHLLGSRSDIPEILKCADLFVHPSMREGLPVSVMEAISSGLQCVTSDVRGCKELMQDIFDGKNLVAINNTHTWMKALKECMNQNFICAEIGLKKIKKYDIKNVNEQLITIYGDL